MRASRDRFSAGRALDDPPQGTVAGPWALSPDDQPFSLTIQSARWSLTWHKVTLPDRDGLLHRALYRDEDPRNERRFSVVTSAPLYGWEISLEGLALPTGTGELMEVRRESPAPDTQE